MNSEKDLVVIKQNEVDDLTAILKKKNENIHNLPLEKQILLHKRLNEIKIRIAQLRAQIAKTTQKKVLVKKPFKKRR